VPWYRITLELRDGSTKTGIRKIDSINIAWIKQDIRSKLKHTIGTFVLHEIKIEELEGTHPDVVALNLAGKSEVKFRHRSDPPH
jgi:hypothetical protein